MRIAFFARRKRRTASPVHIAEALRQLGHRVLLVSYGRYAGLCGARLADAFLRRRVGWFGPDAVLVWKDCISLELLAELGRGCRTAMICADWFPELPEALCARARLCDLLLLAPSGQAEEYRRRGATRVAYWPQAFHPKYHRPSANPPACYRADVAFIGKPGPPHRRDLLKMVGEAFDLKVWGPGWEEAGAGFRGIQYRETLPRQYGLVCGASKVMLGCDVARGVENAFSNRLWLTLGSGGFLVTSYAPGLETTFENHRHLVWYNSPAECVDLIRHYLALPDERRRIAEAGRELVHSRHTYVHRARELVELIEQLPAKRSGT